jgi:protein-S-isoprenylcysteine O-methyltransferase Ste14
MINIQYYASVFLFASLVVSVLVRAVTLRRQGIRAMMFGETNKTDFILMPFVFFVIYTVLANTFGWLIWDVLVKRFWPSSVPGWFGIVMCLAAVGFFIYALVSFGRSFRVGIDEDDPAELVTTGAFAISRNPIYVCFLLFFTGMVLIHCNIVIAITLFLFMFIIHRQIRREEEFLTAHYGEAYQEYCKKVRRYF